MLDNPSVVTLEDPQRHSVHCLVDVSDCNKSPFHVLEANPSNLDTAYGPGWAVDDNSMLLDSARQVGDCSTCDGGGGLKRGYRAEVIGFVLTLDPPVLQVASVRTLDGGEVGCTQPLDPNATAPPRTSAAMSADVFASWLIGVAALLLL